MNNLRHLTLAAALAAGSLLGACKRTETAVEPAQRNTGELVRRDLDNAGDRAARDLDRAGDRIAQGAREAAREAQPGPTRMDFRAALNEIAQARCSREARCNNVGEGRRYMSEQACRTVVVNDFARDLNAAECNAGIDRGELTECMNDIRTEDCNNPLDTLSRVAACRTSDLCRSTTVSAL
ncbi:MAG: DUF6184 family natural product biosynthesis lipoprotein [Polyangiales bacterium]